jgi:hypothetical protein
LTSLTAQDWTSVIKLDALALADGLNLTVVRAAPPLQRFFPTVGVEDHLVFVDASEDVNAPDTC